MAYSKLAPLPMRKAHWTFLFAWLFKMFCQCKAQNTSSRYILWPWAYQISSDLYLYFALYLYLHSKGNLLMLKNQSLRLTLFDFTQQNMAIFFPNYEPTGYLPSPSALCKHYKEFEFICIYKWTNLSTFNHIKQNVVWQIRFPIMSKSFGRQLFH